MTNNPDREKQLADLDRQVDALLAEHHAAAARGDLAAAAAALDLRDEIAREAGVIRFAIEQAQTTAAARLALAGALTDLDLDPLKPIIATRTGVRLPGGITLALRRAA